MKFEDRSPEEIEGQERCARGDARRFAKNILKLKETDKATFFSPTNDGVYQPPSAMKLEEREFVVDSGASVHIVSREKPQLCRIGKPEKSLNIRRRLLHHEKRAFKHRGNTEQSSVLACGFREARDAIVVRVVDGRRVTVYRNDLVELFGLITCGVRGIGKVARLLGARAGVRLTRAFGSGEVRQGSRGRRSRESGLEVTVKEQQGWRMKHENGEGEMERYDMRTANTLSHACTRYQYVHARKLCQKNVRATRSVCTPSVAHTVVATTFFFKKKKKLQTSIPCPP